MIENESIITQYYIIKGLKTICNNHSKAQPRNSKEKGVGPHNMVKGKIYYEFAKLTINSKHGAKFIFHNILDEIYNFDKTDDEVCYEDDAAARGEFGNIEMYKTIIQKELDALI